MGLHLAQVNIARMKAPLEDPLMAQFVARLEEVNALADGSPDSIESLERYVPASTRRRNASRTSSRTPRLEGMFLAARQPCR